MSNAEIWASNYLSSMDHQAMSTMTRDFENMLMWGRSFWNPPGEDLSRYAMQPGDTFIVEPILPTGVWQQLDPWYKLPSGLKLIMPVNI